MQSIKTKCTKLGNCQAGSCKPVALLYPQSCFAHHHLCFLTSAPLWGAVFAPPNECGPCSRRGTCLQLPLTVYCSVGEHVDKGAPKLSAFPKRLRQEETAPFRWGLSARWFRPGNELGASDMPCVPCSHLASWVSSRMPQAPQLTCAAGKCAL